MYILVATLCIVIVATFLATFVAVRAWNYPPARMFVLVVANMLGLNLLALFYLQTADPAVAYLLRSGEALGLAIFTLLLLLTLSLLFTPEWWQGARPIRWIALPYLLVTVVFGIDLAGRMGWFVTDVVLVNEVYSLNVAGPARMVLRILFVVGWLVHLGILAAAFIRQTANRISTALIFLAILFTLLTPLAINRQAELRPALAVFQSMPMLIALGYAVVRTRLFVPTRTAINQAFHGMSEAVVVLDREGRIIYANPRAASLELHINQALSAALSRPGVEPSAAADLLSAVNASVITSRLLRFDDRHIHVSLAPVVDAHGQQQGILLMGRDVTEVERRNRLLEQERSRLATTITQLEAEQQQRAQLSRAVAALGIPVIPVLEGVLVLPLIGDFSAEHVDAFVAALLEGIERQRARLALIDITGVPLIDTAGAAGLLGGIQAAALLGARCVIVGVRPEIAQTLVALGLPLDNLETAATLQQGLEQQLQR